MFADRCPYRGSPGGRVKRLFAAFAEVRERHGADSLRRFERALTGYLREWDARPPDARQRKRSKAELFTLIRRDARERGLSARALADKYGTGKRIVREALRSPRPAPRKPQPLPKVDPAEEEEVDLGEVSLFDLLSALKTALVRYEREHPPPLQLSGEEYSVRGQFDGTSIRASGRYGQGNVTFGDAPYDCTLTLTRA